MLGLDKGGEPAILRILFVKIGILLDIIYVIISDLICLCVSLVNSLYVTDLNRSVTSRET